jgi:hypothetical protein
MRVQTPVVKVAILRSRKGAFSNVSRCRPTRPSVLYRVNFAPSRKIAKAKEE